MCAAHAGHTYSQYGFQWYAKVFSPLQLLVYLDRKSPAIPYRPYCQTLAARQTRQHTMDTDDLSREAYRAIISEVEKFNHDLTLQFGLQSGDCKDEQEFIDKSTQLINELKTADSVDLDDIFFGDVPNLTILTKTLDKILDNIVKVKQIPITKRHFDF